MSKSSWGQQDLSCRDIQSYTRSITWEKTEKVLDVGMWVKSTGIQGKRGVYRKSVMNGSRTVGKKENGCQHHFNT